MNIERIYTAIGKLTCVCLYITVKEGTPREDRRAFKAPNAYVHLASPSYSAETPLPRTVY
jgi:hypothetical protein